MKQIYKVPLFLTILMTIVSTAAAAVADTGQVNTGTAQISSPVNNNFLQIDGIQGESRSSGHEKEIDILSWSFGVGQGAGKSPKPNFENIMITKMFDKSSPKLFLAELTGQQIPKMIIMVRKASGSQDFLKITLEDVIVSNYKTIGSDNGIIDEWGFNYGKILIEYKEQNSEGATISTTSAGWDLITNKPI